MSNDCVCGHSKEHHIYEEGACRSGVKCNCERFVPITPKACLDLVSGAITLPDYHYAMTFGELKDKVDLILKNKLAKSSDKVLILVHDGTKYLDWIPLVTITMPTVRISESFNNTKATMFAGSPVNEGVICHK